MEIVRIEFSHPFIKAMLHYYFRRWGINPQTYVPPAKWIACRDAHGKTLAAMGFTVSPDGRIVYVADLLCIPTRAGIRAMRHLVDQFTENAYAQGVESVCSQCVYANETMRKFLERVGLRPLSVVYAITRKEYEDGRRR